MADYISTLTGVQMDSALIDMAEHTSEAYAVGERNGVPVDSSDVTYHNNARYYAQQAQSIAPASVTEAVRWDVAQTALTDAQREQARENIKATSHNYNLLDNGWFLVNSRGKSSYSASAYMYTADRWYISANGSLTFNGGYITATGAAGGVFGQNLNSFSVGATYTASIKLSDGTINSVTFAASANSENVYTIGSYKLEVDTRTAYAAHPRFMLYANAAWTVNLAAVKLELGSFSTLAYDTPPDYGKELTRCIYSTADPSDTYANNGFGRTNPNLLDNPWFTINQRGFTSATATTSTVYCVDRWTLFAGGAGAGTLTKNANGTLTINNSSGTTNMYMRQPLPNIGVVGKTITISAMTADGTVYTGTGVVPAQNTSYQGVAIATITSTCEIGFTVAPTSLAYPYLVQISSNAGANVTIKAVKLELGSVSTLANDTPPDYGTELLKCQRYFTRMSANSSYCQFATGFISSTTGRAMFTLVNSVPLRATATIAIKNLVVSMPNGTSATVTGVVITRSSANTNTIQLLVSIDTTQTLGTPCALQSADATGYIDISCDL